MKKPSTPILLWPAGQASFNPRAMVALLALSSDLLEQAIDGAFDDVVEHFIALHYEGEPLSSNAAFFDRHMGYTDDEAQVRFTYADYFVTQTVGPTADLMVTGLRRNYLFAGTDDEFARFFDATSTGTILARIGRQMLVRGLDMDFADILATARHRVAAEADTLH